MSDRVCAWLVLIYFLGIPLSTGYFYHRPYCSSSFSDQAPCAFVSSLIWPFLLPANISVRLFD